MNGAVRFSVCLGLVVGVLLAYAQTGRADEVHEFGFVNESIGMAHLNTNGTAIVVSNFGTNGEDGIRWKVPAPTRRETLRSPWAFWKDTTSALRLSSSLARSTTRAPAR